MGTMRIAGRRGDVALRWDPEDPDSVKHARAVWQREVRDRGGAAWRVGAGGKTDRMTAFDPEAAEVIVTPQMQGGAPCR